MITQYFIDRDPKNFGVILNWLRTSRLSPTMMEKLKSNPAELQELCEVTEYFSLSSLQKHLSTLMIPSVSETPVTDTSYPRWAMVTTPMHGFVAVEALRLLKNAGFELNRVLPDLSPPLSEVNGTETLYFKSSKPLSDSTVSRLRGELGSIPHTGLPNASSSCARSNNCIFWYTGCTCRVSFYLT